MAGDSSGYTPAVAGGVGVPTVIWITPKSAYDRSTVVAVAAASFLTSSNILRSGRMCPNSTSLTWACDHELHPMGWCARG